MNDFVVVADIAGNRVERPADSIDRAEQIIRKVASIADSASWLVRQDGDPAPVWLLARQKPGTTGETRRVVHAIGLITGRLVADTLTMLCGHQAPRLDLEYVHTGEGMPCELCLTRLPLPRTPPPLPARSVRQLAIPAPAQPPRVETDPKLLGRVLAGLVRL